MELGPFPCRTATNHIIGGPGFLWFVHHVTRERKGSRSEGITTSSPQIDISQC